MNREFWWASLVVAYFIASANALAKVYPIGAFVTVLGVVLILGVMCLPWDRSQPGGPS